MNDSHDLTPRKAVLAVVGAVVALVVLGFFPPAPGGAPFDPAEPPTNPKIGPSAASDGFHVVGGATD